MKKMFFAFVLALGLASCNDGGNNVTIQSNSVPNFNIPKMGQLIEKSTDPGTLEASINDPSNGINNLDQNSDGKVDYVRVKELPNNKLQVTDVDVNPEIVIATVDISKNAQGQTSLNVQGNQSYCGTDNLYHHELLTDLILWSYLTRPMHPYYASPYHSGYYPKTYTTTTTRRVYNSTPTSSYKPSSSGSSSSSWFSSRKSVSNPSSSQRSFSVSSNDGSRRSTGFGSSSSSSSRSYSPSRSSYGSSSSGF